MTYEEFKNRVREEIRDYLPEKYRTAKVDIVPLRKNNGITPDGLYVITGSDTVIPAIHLKEFYAMHQKGECMEDILFEIALIYMEAQEEAPDFGEEDFRYENVKNSLTVTACNAEMNKKILQDVPHERREDIALVYRVRVPVSEIETGMITVHNSYLEAWGIGEDQLKKDAWENMRREDPAVFKGMSDIINGEETAILFDEKCSAPFMENEIMFVLSNHDNVQGAVYMFDEELMEKIAEKLDSSLVIFPSSIHECIILRETQDMDVDCMRDIVQEVNATQVLLEERLSDEVYRYDRENHALSMVKAERPKEDILPDTVEMEEMHGYGYLWDGMLPLGREKALELMDCGLPVYCLYMDNTEGMADKKEEIYSHDGMFGIEKETWESHLEERNPNLERNETCGMIVV